MKKFIRVEESTHKKLKIGAANKGVNLKDFVEILAEKNINGVAFDVDAYDKDMLLAVLQDIVIKLERTRGVIEVDDINLTIYEILKRLGEVKWVS